MFIPRMSYEKTEKKIIIFSGAGLDQPSGIQTFRDSNGLWENHKIDEICNEFTWKKNFNNVHEFYNDRRIKLGTVKPNEAHKTIKRIIDTYGEDEVYHITMNVSDLNERVGSELLHLHGKLTEMICLSCEKIWDIGYSKFEIEKNRCPSCNSLNSVKPNIVFFGGQVPMYSYMKKAFEYLKDPETILLVIGTTGTVINLNTYLKNTPAYKVLIDVKVSEGINENNFDKIILSGAIDGMLEVEKIIKEKRNNGNK